MKNRIIITCAFIILIATLAALLMGKLNKKDSNTVPNVYEPGYSEDVSESEKENETVREDDEMEYINKGFENIKRHDELVKGNDRYINTDTNTSSFEISEASVVTQSIIDYLNSNGYSSGTIYSNKNGPDLLDGYTEFYADALMFIQEQYPEWSDDFYFEYITEDDTESFYLIEIGEQVIRVDFSY